MVVDCCHDGGVLWCDWDGGLWLDGVMYSVSLLQVECFQDRGGVVLLFLCWVKCFHLFVGWRYHQCFFFVVDGELLVSGVSLFVSNSFTVDSLDVLCDSGVG